MDKLGLRELTQSTKSAFAEVEQEGTCASLDFDTLLDAYSARIDAARELLARAQCHINLGKSCASAREESPARWRRSLDKKSCLTPIS